MGNNTKQKSVRGRTNSKGQTVNSKGELRKRCLTTGCNPVMYGDDAAKAYRDETGHRTANMPVRSAERLAKDKLRGEEARKLREEERAAKREALMKDLCDCYFEPDECCNRFGCCTADPMAEESPCCDGAPMYESFEDGYGEGF